MSHTLTVNPQNSLVYVTKLTGIITMSGRCPKTQFIKVKR